jgi:methionyl-tRNA formyltransferase
MRIVLLCATRRGLMVLERLSKLTPQAKLVVFSFREEPWEPPFLDAIREHTLKVGGTFHETRNVGADKWTAFWQEASVDLMLAVSWRYLIPPEVYRKARCGAFVFHDALLPEYRGFAPTVWAIANGEDHTGVTLFEIAPGVDEGDIVDQESVPIGPEETIGVVIDRVTAIYLEILERNLVRLLEGTAPRRPQEHSRATFTCRRTPEDNAIDWRASTASIFNLIRAVTIPYSGAFTSFEGKALTIWGAQRLASTPRFVGRVPGRVIEMRPGEGAVVLTGDGALLVTRVQLQGGPVVFASEILNSLSATLGR